MVIQSPFVIESKRRNPGLALVVSGGLLVVLTVVGIRRAVRLGRSTSVATTGSSMTVRAGAPVPDDQVTLDQVSQTIEQVSQTIVVNRLPARV